MNIVEFFDPSNITHLQAYDYLQHNGTWPEDFFPRAMEFKPGWQVDIMSKIVDEYIQFRIDMYNKEYS